MMGGVYATRVMVYMIYVFFVQYDFDTSNKLLLLLIMVKYKVTRPEIYNCILLYIVYISLENTIDSEYSSECPDDHCYFQDAYVKQFSLSISMCFNISYIISVCVLTPNYFWLS